MSALSTVQKFFPQVKRVIDATRRAEIEVSQTDAKSEGKKDHATCAFATACKRSFHLDGVIISRSKAYLVKGTIARRFLVPHSVGREVVSFDRGAGFAPGYYSLSAPSKATKLGVKPPGRVKPRKDRLLKPRFRHVTNKIRTVLGGELPQE